MNEMGAAWILQKIDIQLIDRVVLLYRLNHYQVLTLFVVG